MAQFLSLGLDIGTTTVSAVVVNTVDGTLLASRTEKSNADIPSSDPGEKIQDPKMIQKLVFSVLEELLDRFPAVNSIGITGQMHGILYLNAEGEPISPLYTWQDQQGAHLCAQLRERTGYPASPGYGLVTHCALEEKRSIPGEAWKLCTIMDYLAYLLCGRQQLLMHTSNAASLGFFDVKKGQFDMAALAGLGIDAALLPSVTSDTVVQGCFREIPVAVSIGDNQASFLGSVSQPETMALANFGTGSQISRMVREFPALPNNTDVEVRPFLGRSYLLCGSALCGGRAYALLEKCFRSFAARCGLQDANCYEILNILALEGLEHKKLPLVETTFSGTRSDPEKRGSIIGLEEDNFSPAAFAAGTLLGMARELRQLLEQMGKAELEQLAVSGNAARQNPALVKAVERMFGKKTVVPAHREEAAFGAALFGAAAAQGYLPEHLMIRWVKYL